MVDLIGHYEDWDCVITRLAPILTQKTSHSPFVLAAIRQLLERQNIKGAADGEVLKLCESQVKSLISPIDISTLLSQDVPTAAPSAKRLGDKNSMHVQNHHGKAPPNQFKIVEQVNNYHPANLQLWLQFLRSLAYSLTYRNVPLSTPRYQQIAIAIFDAYLDNYIGKEPPNSATRKARFRMSETRREHLQLILRRSKSDCRHWTERSRSPHVLVVLKNNEKMEREINAWADRFHVARQEMERFNPQELRSLLGENYENITRTSRLRRAVVTQPVTGLKRKAEEGINVDASNRGQQ
ncbi:hypothetical protein B0H63DRAFT_522062 [Podospora didyma]|uniref:Uncharacterized protein n=1 Tax=Podospora didyma TaxID=330526 RepID=A0AAE0U2D7_9PEZI|nr:hypothetical protein B0H63DRAFT_522062 [Podospora didyma]